MSSTKECIPQKISKFVLALILSGAALALVVIGVTLLPIIGIVMALPVAALAVYFFRIHLNDQCEIDVST